MSSISGDMLKEKNAVELSPAETVKAEKNFGNQLKSFAGLTLKSLKQWYNRNGKDLNAFDWLATMNFVADKIPAL